MERKSFQDVDCSVAQCLEVVGEWWTMLIVRDVFLGVRRFDAMQRRLGISRNVLTQRLEKLVEVGVLRREVYQERPVRHEYRLTEKGLDLWPVLTAMRQWGDRYAAPNGPRLQLRHQACDHVVEPTLHCPACGEEARLRDYRIVPGAGDPGGRTLPTAVGAARPDGLAGRDVAGRPDDAATPVGAARA